MLEIFLLLFGIVIGQLYKFPLPLGGINFLDLVLLVTIIINLPKLKLILKAHSHQFLILIFLFWATLSLIFSPLHLSAQELISSSFYLFRLAIYIFAAAILSLKNPNQIFNLITFSAIFLSTIGILQIIFVPDLKFLADSGYDPHFFRIVSTFLDPNFLGAYLSLALITLIAYPIKNQKIILALIFCTLAFTFSRSSYLAFLVGTSILALQQKSWKILTISLVGFAVLMLIFNLYTFSVSAPRNIDRNGSANARLSTWQQGLQIFYHAPITGVGFNSYNFALSRYNLAEPDFLKTHGATTNDSSILYILDTTGIIGLTILLLFVLQNLRLAVHQKYFLPSIVAALTIHSSFNNSFFYPPILIIFLTLIFLPNPKK